MLSLVVGLKNFSILHLHREDFTDLKDTAVLHQMCIRDRALGIKNGDTDSYTNVVGKSISRDGITITLNEIVMDSKNLWIAYSDSEDSDADMKDAVEDKLLYTEVCINGQKIQQGLGQRTVNAFSENPITVEDFTIGEEVNTCLLYTSRCV